MFWRRKTVSMINCDVYGDDIYDEVDGDDDNLEDVGLRSWTVAGVDPSGVDAQPPRAIQCQHTEQHKYRWKYKDTITMQTQLLQILHPLNSVFFLCILIRIFLYLH